MKKCKCAYHYHLKFHWHVNPYPWESNVLWQSSSESVICPFFRSFEYEVLFYIFIKTILFYIYNMYSIAIWFVFSLVIREGSPVFGWFLAFSVQNQLFQHLIHGRHEKKMSISHNKVLYFFFIIFYGWNRKFIHIAYMLILVSYILLIYIQSRMVRVMRELLVFFYFISHSLRSCGSAHFFHRIRVNFEFILYSNFYIWLIFRWPQVQKAGAGAGRERVCVCGRVW